MSGLFTSNVGDWVSGRVNALRRSHHDHACLVDRLRRAAEHGATNVGPGPFGLWRQCDLIKPRRPGGRMARMGFNLVIVLIQAYLLVRAVVVFFEAGIIAALVFVLLAAAFSWAKFPPPNHDT